MFGYGRLPITVIPDIAEMACKMAIREKPTASCCQERTL